ncbi:coenzyme F420 hydrogenase/dehydrogenase, beta subunit [Thermoplasmatales archaeon SCGC AB-540-F20]|nr:coenzyme F420 hydrogenase/dehydrogenase, beta subunit [Thermoplasmatales archaeon SCGC AB-540-F20]
MVDEKQLRDAVKKTISRDDVKYVVGYEKGTYGFQATPCYAYNPEDAEKFIFSPLCVHNLAVFPMLEEKPPLRRGEEPDTRKIGVVVKGCDSRAIVQIIQEKGLDRDKVVIIGIPCTGVVDPKKLEAKFPGHIKNAKVEDEDDKFAVTVDGKTQKIPKDELMPDKCKTCEYPTPIIYDILIGKEIKSNKKEDYKKVNAFEKKSLKEKWEYWEKQFEKCIRCYACRNACPLCYCKECMVDQLDPQWVRRSVDLSENTAWNLLRAFHLAGRCIGCGQCERACPMDIPLMELNKKIEREIKELFEYEAGINAEEKPLLAMFKPDDPEEFIL